MADASIVIDVSMVKKNFGTESRGLAREINSFREATVKTAQTMKQAAGDYGKAMLASARESRQWKDDVVGINDTIENVRRNLEKFGSTKVATGDYKKVTAEIENENKALARLNERRTKMAELGTDVNPKYATKRSKLENVNKELSDLLAKRKEIENEIRIIKGDIDRGTDSNGNALSTDDLKSARAVYSAYKSLLEDLKAQIDDTKERGKKLRDELVKMSDNDELRSAGAKSLDYDIENRKEQIANLESKKKDLESKGEGAAWVKGENTTAFREMQTILSDLIDKAKRFSDVRKKSFEPPYMKTWKELPTLTGMVSSGFGRVVNVVRGAGYALTHPFGALNRALGTVLSTVGSLIQRLGKMAGHAVIGFLKRLAASAKNAAIQLARLASNAVKNGIKHLGGWIGNGVKSMLGLNKSTKSTGESFGRSFKNILKYAFGIRSLFFLFRRLRKAISDGLGELKKKDPELKAAVSSLQKSFNALKGSLASAFAPIITAVAPALTTLINLLATAINTLGAFFAALMGKKYYAASVGGLSAVGRAAGGASRSAKELKNQLAGFDELEILKENNGGGGGSGSGFSYEDMPIESGIREFADTIRKLFAEGAYEEIGRVIARGINSALQKLQDYIKWENIEKTVTKIITAFTQAFDGLVDELDWSLLGRTIGEGIRSLVRTIQLLVESIDWGNLGKKLGECLTALVGTIEWDRLGETIVDILTIELRVIGNAMANFDWTGFGHNLATGFNAAIGRLDEVIKSIQWETIAGNLTSGLNKFIFETDWVGAANTVADFAGSIISALKRAVTEFEWGNAGTKLGEIINTFFKREEIWADAGATVAGMIKGILDFTENFVVTFDPVQAAKDIKAALKPLQEKWPEIREEVIRIAKTSWGKFGDFMRELLGLDEGDDWIQGLAIKIGEKIGEIPWDEIFETLKQEAFKAISGIWSGLISNESGKTFLKILGSAILLKGGFNLLGKAIAGGLLNIKSILVLGIGAAVLAAGIGLEKLQNVVKQYYDSLDEFEEANRNLKDTILKSFTKLYKEGMDSGDFSAAEKYLKMNGVVDVDLKLDKGSFKKSYNLLSDALDQELELNGSKEEKKHLLKIGISYGLDPNSSTFIRDAKALKEAIEQAVNTGEWKFDAEMYPTVPQEAIDKAFQEAQSIASDMGLELKVNADTTQFQVDIDNLKEDIEWNQAHPTIPVEIGIENYDALKNMFTTGKAYEYLIESGANICEVLAKGLDEHDYSLIETGENIVVDLGDGMVKEISRSDILDQFRSLGYDVVDGMVIGIDDDMDDSTRELLKLFGMIPDAAEDTLEIGSPSKVFKRIGGFIVDGLIGGLSTLTNALKRVWNGLPKWVKQMINGALSFVLGAEVDIGDALDEISDSLDQDFNVDVDVDFSPGGTNSSMYKNRGLLGFLNNVLAPGTKTNAKVSLQKDNWTTLDSFVGTLSAVGVELKKHGWTTISDFVGTLVNVFTNLKKQGWSTIDAFVGTAVDVLTKLKKGNWTSIGGFVGTLVTVVTNLTKNNSNWQNKSLLQWLTGDRNGRVLISIGATARSVSSLADWVLRSIGLKNNAANNIANMMPALNGIKVSVPNAAGSIVPYEVAAQIAKSTAAIQNTLDENNEDLIQTIISVIGAQTTAIVTALQAVERKTGNGMNYSVMAQRTIDEINRRTLMYSSSPLKGV